MGRTPGARDGRDRAGGVGEVALAAVLPGVGLARRHRRGGVALLLLGVVLPLVWLAVFVLMHGNMVGLGLDSAFLAQLAVMLAVGAVVRLVAVVETVIARRDQDGQQARDLMAAVTVIAVCAPAIVGAQTAVEARADLARAFEEAPPGPIFDASAAVSTVPHTLPPEPTDPPAPILTVPPTVALGRRLPPERIPNLPPPPPKPPDSGVDPALLADVSTILLLGGDAGPGRSGLRTDTMILVSIHRPSGRAALISVPRDLERLLFPPDSAMGQRHPRGFDDIANAVYPRVARRGSLRDAYSVEGLQPGAIAIAQGIGYSLDVTIDDYVLIDMRGFVEVVDALGGVTVEVPRAVPTPGNPPGAKHTVPPVIGIGTHSMDGTLALAYVRSRKADSDYRRAQRQREVLGALARQVSFADAFAGYSAVTGALGDTLRTSLTPDEFVALLGLIGGETAIVESMGLVPPLVNPGRPNYDEMAKIVGRVQMAIITGEPSGY